MFPDCIPWHSCIVQLRCKLILHLPSSLSKAVSCCRDPPPAPWWRNRIRSLAQILCLMWKGHLPVPCTNHVSGFFLLFQSLGFLQLIQLPINTYHKSSAQLVAQLLTQWQQQLARRAPHLCVQRNKAQSVTVARCYLLWRPGQPHLGASTTSTQCALILQLPASSFPGLLARKPAQPTSVPALSLSSTFAIWIDELLSIQCSLLINVFPSDLSFFPCGAGKFLRVLCAAQSCLNMYLWPNCLSPLFGQVTGYA